ncbi:hypothetical protein JHJ32_17295 [Parapedobacter sp. ISTM3]|uniref:Uncharacterized protein n=1 Tax=Parapedobacter luteus TaxID=623280 RepID=A0A1T5AJC8_9SPHI|nr:MULTISPECIES: hypothetical protein [Parapedobacter]MBK1441758.1 hypothetical protein [Parapedobacter sp. ISTM3]SKB34975.1 hypothetical protein SAMN05660226_00810 [Parapedobacter luteus]
MKEKNVTGTQDKSRKGEMGSSTADKAFADSKKQKRAQGLPNAGGVRTGQIKKDK